MRRIDPKFHIEGDKLIKTSNGQEIPEDEPIMLIRARDWLALPIIAYYYAMSLRDSCTDYHLSGVWDRMQAFMQFRKDHPERMKQPGCTQGA